MIGASDVPAVNATEMVLSEGVSEVSVGAPGTALGVTLPDAAEKTDCPKLLTAAILNWYAVPLVSPVTRADFAADVPSAKVCQSGDEPAVAYCTT